MHKKASPEALLAPSASYGGAARKLPGSASFPPLDERLVTPETREEMVRGKRVYAQPAAPPHGDRHFALDYVLGAHIRPGYLGSTDLLTRAAYDSDFATDTCIRKEGKDPETGGRYLEEVAFEIVNEQSTKHVTERAEDLARRGVRRVFAIFVKTRTVKEWVPALGAFRELEPTGSITDACLTKPLLVKGLLDAAVGEEEVVYALDAKGNRAIEALKAESEKRGEERGEKRGEERGEERGALKEAAAAVLTVLTSRGLDLPAAVRAAIEQSTDIATLRRWLARAATAASADDVID